MIAVVAGSTGLTGSLLTRKLLDDPAFTAVVTVSRRSRNLDHPRLREVIVPSLAELSWHADQLCGDVYFCCLGTTIKVAGSRENFRAVDHDAVLDFARIAHRHTARAFLVVTAMGANPKSAFFYNRVKGETERDLQSLGLRSLIIFRPGLLLGLRHEPRPAEALFQALLAPVHRALPALTRPWVTPADTLAAAMLRHAHSPTPGTTVVEAGAIKP